MKVCRRCKETKPLVNFYEKQGKYFFPDCINCEQEKRKLAPRKEKVLKQKTAESKYKSYLYFEKNFEQLKRIVKLIQIIDDRGAGRHLRNDDNVPFNNIVRFNS